MRFLTLVGVVLLFGCGGSGSSSTTDAEFGLVENEAIEGEWTSNCYLMGENDIGMSEHVYAVEIILVQNDRYRREVYGYEDSACTILLSDAVTNPLIYSRGIISIDDVLLDDDYQGIEIKHGSSSSPNYSYYAFVDDVLYAVTKDEFSLSGIGSVNFDIYYE